MLTSCSQFLRCGVARVAGSPNPVRRIRLLSATALATLIVSAGAAPPAAHAQSPAYPSKTVRVVAPFPPGGTTDLVGRLIAQGLGKRLGQNFIIDNRGGAGGLIGTDIVAKAQSDGYTLLVGASGPIMMLPGLTKKLPYDVLGDFETIANIVTVPNLMVVPASSRFGTLKDLIDHAKSNPGRVRYASGGVGSSGHVAGALLGSIAGIDMQHVPYRGAGVSLVGVMAGEADVIFVNLPSALPLTRSGKLRGIVVMSDKRASTAPEYPTTAEVGMPRFVLGSSTGLLAPKRTSRKIVALLDEAMKALAEEPEYTRQFALSGADIDFMNAARYRAFISAEIARFTDLGKKANITAE